MPVMQPLELEIPTQAISIDGRHFTLREMSAPRLRTYIKLLQDHQTCLQGLFNGKGRSPEDVLADVRRYVDGGSWYDALEPVEDLLENLRAFLSDTAPRIDLEAAAEASTVAKWRLFRHVLDADLTDEWFEEHLGYASRQKAVLEQQEKLNGTDLPGNAESLILAMARK